MNQPKCIGVDVATNSQVAIFYEQTIRIVDHLIHPMEDLPYVSPGWIDLQVNGFAGVDYNAPDALHEEIGRSIRVLFSTGVTRFFPTIITGPAERMAGALANLAVARRELPEGRAMEGFHMEGPHISPEEGARGAHPAEYVRPPDIDEYRRWQEVAEGNVKIVTVSPEWPSITAYIEEVVSDGVVISIGHTKATTEQIDDAVRAGATMSTHLGNGAPFMIPRFPNYIWDQLANDRLTAGFIVDGIHLPASYVKVALRAKGTDRSFFVTDAVMPAGCEPGPYVLGTVAVTLHPGERVTLRDSERLAGSASRIDRGVENLMRQGEVSLPEAMAMVTRNPARAARIGSRTKGLAPGERADFTLFNYDSETRAVKVLETVLSGETVFRSES